MRRADQDEDRGAGVGAAIGVAMLVLLQALLAGCYVVATRSGDWAAPLRFAGFTQLMYVAPTVLLFVNRGCPRMAAGFGAVAGAVLFANLAWLALG